MQEGVLAMERGQLERAEKRLMAAREQLRQLNPMSWSMFKAGHLVMELRLAKGQKELAAEVAREQLGLVEKLRGDESLETEPVLRDLAVIIEAGASGEESRQAMKRLKGLAHGL
jgi:hypothetical protein